jgi:hypothetical protein
MSSSFILGNVDRFGNQYLPKKQIINVPGPGYYKAPSAFNKA